MGLAIAALVGGIVAFFSGLAPFWGIIVALAAVILGIIALRRGQSKGLALTGLILGAVGGVVSIIATIVFVVALVAAGNLGNVTVDPGTGQEQPGEEPPVVAGPDGSRENPLAIGATISSDEFDVVVNSITVDATDEVVGENMFNDHPEDGMIYSLVNASITYTGSDSSYASFVSFALVSDTGEVYDSTDTFVVAPDGFGLDELYNGGTVTGNVALQVPSDFTGLLRVRPGLLADELFFALP